jgi:type I restriction enzyme S subunit
MTATDMMKNDINSGKFVSKKHTNTANLLLEKGWVLVSRSGTLGNVVYTNKDFEGVLGTDDLIRIIPKNTEVKGGYLYAYLASKYGYGLLIQSSYGAVVQHIEPHHIMDLPIPIFPLDKQEDIHKLIVEASSLRVKANGILKESQKDLKESAGLEDLQSHEYEYFGNHSSDRHISAFKQNIKKISSLTINAFNYSKKVELLENRVKDGNHLTLSECIDEQQFFSSGSFKRLEINSPKSIKLINQSDIFNIVKKGKLLARKFVKVDKLVEYGEVIIAGVGTLGEGETFCRSIFANEELEGQLISGEFIRMKPNANVPSGYLYSWLSSDYGFRFIRKTQSGTKLCRPIQELLKELPVPILEWSEMQKIDEDVKKAHSMMHEALLKEKSAIELVEKEMESWQG